MSVAKRCAPIGTLAVRPIGDCRAQTGGHFGFETFRKHLIVKWHLVLIGAQVDRTIRGVGVNSRFCAHVVGRCWEGCVSCACVSSAQASVSPHLPTTPLAQLLFAPHV